MTEPVSLPGDRPVATVVGELRERNRPLSTVALVNLGLAVLFTALLAVDGRTLLGRSVWLKPWKFAASIAVFTATMGWLLPSLRLGDRAERTVSWVIAGAMTSEILLITAQAARGVRSHFNLATTLDASVFALMGISITVSTLAVTYVLWRTLRTPPAVAPAYRWGISLGLLVFVLASFEGGLMAARGSHTVGTAVGGEGLPVVNWSLSGGDLRVAHFIGLHALQVLPLAGYAAARWGGLSTRGSLAAVGGVATLHGGLVVATFVQALRGVPVVASLPDVALATVFTGSVLLVAPFWLLMLVAPDATLTRRVVGSPLVVLPVATLYLALLLPQAGAVAGGVLRPSLDGATALLATDAGTTLAWVHFLAFDLLAGRWLYLDAGRRGVPHAVVAPALLLTLWFGPVGLLVYLAARPVFGVQAGSESTREAAGG